MAPLTIILRKKMFSKRSTFEIYTFETKFFDKKFILKNLPYYLNYPNSRFNHKEIWQFVHKQRNIIIFNILKQFYLLKDFFFSFDSKIISPLLKCLRLRGAPSFTETSFWSFTKEHYQTTNNKIIPCSVTQIYSYIL